MTRNNKFHVIHVVSRGGDRFSQNGKIEARKIFIGSLVFSNSFILVDIVLDFCTMPSYFASEKSLR